MTKFLLGNMLSAMQNKKYFYDRPVVVEYNALCKDVLDVLAENGYIKSYEVKNVNNKKSIDVLLKVVNDRKMINSFKLISTPGCRIYKNCDELKKLQSYNPFALNIVSTSKGVMTIGEAIENKVGGELLCEIF